jgi:diguanylate cyclase (GGDEF)-like protein/PAS domain S-box-containing protein
VSSEPDPINDELHPLLKRQLRRSGVEASGAGCTPAALADLINRVSRSYAERDRDRYLLERAQDLASGEMTALYTALRADRDLLERRVVERTGDLALSESRLASLLSLSADWIWEADREFRLTFVSDGLRHAAGIEPDELLARSLLLHEMIVDMPGGALGAYEACVERRQPFREVAGALARVDGNARYLRLSGEPVFDGEGGFAGYRGVGRDVTLFRQAEQKVQELATSDSLTGLPNRNMFMSELNRAIAHARRHESPFAICFIDLDRFKIINDTLGHQAGDELLRGKAARLRSSVRGNDLVARLGGDEFVVLLDGVVGVEAITAVAVKLLKVLAEPVTIGGNSFLVTGSIGIATWPSDGDDPATLLKHADVAMYQAKAQGKNNLQFYTAELADNAARQFELESELRRAIEQDELLLHFQAKFDVANQGVVGMEALVRWMHPARGLVPPMDFIPLAEERGLIVPLGRWVIHAACRQVRDWRASGLAVPPVAFNLSARQFASNSLLHDIEEAMSLYGVSPCNLEVELTESVLMTDPERADEVLQRLHTLGLRISIDDFGTGYSSLSYLKRLPAQAVKIDRSFISGLPSDRNDQAITRAVIAMAHSLGLSVIAEGVETREQLDMLGEMGCDQIQGYLLGRPLPPAEMGQRLARLSARGVRS